MWNQLHKKKFEYFFNNHNITSLMESLLRILPLCPKEDEDVRPRILFVGTCPYDQLRHHKLLQGGERIVTAAMSDFHRLHEICPNPTRTEGLELEVKRLI